METVLLALGIACIFGTVGAVIAEHRGVPAWAGAGLGFLLGPLGTLLAAVLPTNVERAETRDERLAWEAEQKRIWQETGR